MVQVAAALEADLAEDWEEAKREMVAPGAVMAPVESEVELEVESEGVFLVAPEAWEEATAVGRAMASNKHLVSSLSYGKQREEYSRQYHFLQIN